MNSDKFVVIRAPVLMEDEGNFHILAICDTLQEVADFCNEFTAVGYFSLGDLFYIGCGGRVRDLSFLPKNIKEYL